MKKHNWKKLVTRPFTLLTADFVLLGSAEELPKLLGVHLDQKMEIIEGLVDVYEDLDSRLYLNKVFAERAKKDSNFLLKHEKEGRKKFQNLVKVSEKIGKSNLKIENNRLIQYLERYKEAFYQYTPFLYTVFSAEALLTKKLLEQIAKEFPGQSEEENQNTFRTLTAVDVESDFFQEQKGLLEMAVAKYEEKSIEKHAKTFGYMGLTNSLLSTPHTEKHFRNLIKEIRNPKQELDKLIATREQESKEYKELAQKISSDIVKTARILQKYTLFRNDRITALKIAQHNIKSLLSEIAERFDISLEDLYWYKLQELYELLAKGLTPNILKRKKYVSVTLINNSIFYSESPKKDTKRQLKQKLTGYPASQGIVQGRVKLVLSTKDINKVKDGDILVSAMTTPDLVPAMRKAGAIVTDEGGVLCHAAIVSREFGIPCVVGTLEATKTFKDEDLVEVDAVKGVVTKLN